MNPVAYIVDDDKTICESLAFLLDSVNISYKIYYSPEAFLQDYQHDRPCCLLLDVRMPKISGFCLQDTLIKRQIPLPIIFMTGHGDVHMAVRAMQKGALDFFIKPFRHQLLLEAIEKGFKISENQLSNKEKYKTFSCLTEQEHNIIQHIIQGHSSKAMAKMLNLSIKTIEYHRAKILRKLNLNKVVELVHAYALYQNYIEQY